LVFDGPAEVRDAEPHGVRRSGKLNIIYEDDGTLPQEPAGVDEVEEHGLEPVVPIDEGEIELPAVSEEAGEQNLRLLAVELDEVANTGLFQRLNSDAGVFRPTRRSFNELVRVGGDMTPAGSVR
jgi:hypothetical protein